jgi:hypothetical protein
MVDVKRHIIPAEELHMHDRKTILGAEGDPLDWPHCDCRCQPERKWDSEREMWIFTHHSLKVNAQPA